MEISGKTKIMFILADPVAHIRGSVVMTSALRALGHDIAISPLHVRPADLKRAVQAIRGFQNVVGFGITIPHKIAVCPFIDELLPQAKLVGSVNFVRRDADGRLIGDNIDGAGFVDGAQESGIDFKGKRVLQIGAGGAGRSIAFSVAGAGAAAIGISNRTEAKARGLAHAVRAAYPNCEAFAAQADASGYDSVVNASSVGMKPEDPLMIDPTHLAPGMTVSEIIMAPEMTPLLLEAQKRGCKISLGKTMLEHQVKRLEALLGL
ncbi:MAG TPA: shikimate dehydrogenase [Dongiaceae bacterium]|jgi:shikimate dehydrogenase|nr:shikimate dehydrogenase [Dongiaceae bacterium]